MYIGQVIGNVVSTKKADSLTGQRFLVIDVIEQDNGNVKKTGQQLVAVDVVGAGRGEFVLISTGSAARCMQANTNTPIDAAIIGIIDSFMD